MIRRAIAHLVMLTFCFSAVEVVVADVHDGDAAGARVTILEQSSPGPVNGDTPESGSSHHLHVCHCVHAHGGILPAAQDAAPGPHVRATLQRPAIAEPAAVDIDVQVRPPIA